MKNSFETALQDFLTRKGHGESPDPYAYLARYQGCRKELRKFFVDMHFLDSEHSRTPRGDTAAPADEQSKSADLSTGDLPRIEGFSLIEELGSGGQGVVYKAVQSGTERLVALKVLREGAFASKLDKRRFQNEVELVAKLNHPHIVSVYACGLDLDRQYFAMEFIEGQPLDVYLSTHTLETDEALGLFLQICDAISYAHQCGVIHRDLKPSNVLIDTSGKARIVDFGLAKPVASSDVDVRFAITRVGDFAGTWYYASPEQIKGDSALVDVRSEVFTLGIILYELLTDAYPFETHDSSRESIARCILDATPRTPRSIRRDLDKDIETFILRCLAKEPQRRYQSAAALGEDLRRYLAREAIEARREQADREVKSGDYVHSRQRMPRSGYRPGRRTATRRERGERSP